MRPASVITDQKIQTWSPRPFHHISGTFLCYQNFVTHLSLAQCSDADRKALHSFISRSVATHDEIKGRTDLEPPDLEELAHRRDRLVPSSYGFEGALNGAYDFVSG